MNTANTPNIRRFAAITAIFVVAALGLYGRTISFPFVSLDDSSLVYLNPAVQGITFDHLKTIFTTFDPELYIPFTLLSYQVDSAIGGGAPWIFHLTNLILHTMNAVLVTILLRTVFRRQAQHDSTDISLRLSKSDIIPLLTGLLFLIHPIQTETVAWISARKDLLMTTFALGTMLTFLYWERTVNRRWLVLSLALFLCALLSKVTAAVVPLLLLLLTWLETRDRRFLRILTLVPFASLAMAFIVIAFIGKPFSANLSIFALVALGLRMTSSTLLHIVWPFGLSVFYVADAPVTLADPRTLVALLLISALAVVAAWRWTKRDRLPLIALFMVLITLTPNVFNLVKDSVTYVTSDRYAYLPFVGIALLVADLLRRISDPRRAVIGVIVVLVCLGVLTFRQSSIWANDETLNRYALTIAPTSHVARTNLGNALRERGALQDALAEYQRVIARTPTAHQAYYNRGLTLELLQRNDEAIADYRKALELNPHYALAAINLGRLVYQNGNLADAIVIFGEAAAMAPHLAMPHYNIAVLEGEQQHWPSALAAYRAALERDPDFLDARLNLAHALVQIGDLAVAQAELDEAIQRHGQTERVLQFAEYLRKQQ